MFDEKHLSTIKDAPERWMPAKRGTVDQKMKRYHSRACFIMTGNQLPTRSEPVLKRIITIRFDASSWAARHAKSEECDRAFEALKPIGFDAVRRYVIAHPSKTELLENIKLYAHKIRQERRDWASPQRPMAWAVVYLGLKVFEEECEAFGVEWHCPSVEEFVKSVVEPNEQSTWDARKKPIEEFVDWLSVWFATRKRRIREPEGDFDVIVGEGELWAPHKLVISGEQISGCLITEPMLAEYNKDPRTTEKILTLKELAMQAAEAAGIPYDEVLDSDRKRVKKFWICRRSLRAAFVPLSYEDRGQKVGKLVNFSEPVDLKNHSQALPNFPRVGEDLPNIPTDSQALGMDPPDLLADADTSPPSQLQ